MCTRRVKKGRMKMKPWGKSTLIYTNFFHCPQQHKNTLHLKGWFCEIWTSMTFGHLWQGQFIELPLPPPFPPALFSSPVPIHSLVTQDVLIYGHVLITFLTQDRKGHFTRPWRTSAELHSQLYWGVSNNAEPGKGRDLLSLDTSVKLHHKHQQANVDHKSLDNKGLPANRCQLRFKRQLK